MNGHVKRVLAGAVLLAVMMGAALAQAPKGDEKTSQRAPMAPRPMMAPGGGPGMHLLNRMIDFGLDDKQIVKLTKLQQANLEEALPLIREEHNLREEEKGLRDDPAANRDRLVAITKRMGEIKAEMQGQHIDMMVKVKKDLTAEQLEKLGDKDLFGAPPRFHRGGPDGMRRPPRFPHGGGMGPDCPDAPDAPDAPGEEGPME